MDADERAAAARAAGAATGEVAAAAQAIHAAVGRGVAHALGRAVQTAGTGPGAGSAAAAVERAGRIPVGVAQGWYAAVRGAAPVAGTAVGAALRATTPQGATTWSESPRGSVAVAWLGAAFGDHLAAFPGTRALAPPMSVRVGGRAVRAEELREVFPDAGPRLCVLVHGLGGHEAQWVPELLEAVTAEGFTPVSVRYTTGLPIAENGRALSVLLDDLVSAWPVVPEQIVVVGHSMGGLVARSAAAQPPGEGRRTAPWTSLLTDLVTLGAPHAGAPLERVSHRMLEVLHGWDPVRPLAQLGHRRSAGIKDLRFGALLDEHWGGRDPDDVGADRASDPTGAVPLPSGTRHVAVIGSLASDPDGILARAAGDGLVPPASAAGRPGADDRVVHVRLGGVGHLGLLADPRCVDSVADVLAGRTVRGAQRSTRPRTD